MRRSIVAIVVVFAMLSGVAAAEADEAPIGAERVDLKYQLDQIVNVYLERNADGDPIYVLEQASGQIERLSPAQFANRLLSTYDARPWWKRFLNITNPVGIAWVMVGLLGQVLFTGRMIVQWFVSEKERRSVVPPAFWWMSLIGATMLLIYFGWRKDVVGILGQATGWFIYVRNLWFIHGPSSLTDDPGPEAELAE